MGTLAGIARTGLVTVLLHPLRSATVVVCLVAVLAPFTMGGAVARAMLAAAEESIAAGADLHVGGRRFGRPAPVPLAAVDAVRAIPGVRAVTPRVVGTLPIGRERIEALVVGLPAAALPPGTRVVDGELYRPGRPRELVLGAALADRLGLEVGSLVPPFYRNPAGQRIATVVGTLESDLPAWSSRMILCSLATAQELFDQRGLATDLLVDCDPATTRAVEEALEGRLAPDLRDGHGAVALAVRSRAELRAELPASLRHLEGLFHLHLVLAFAVGLPLLAVASGVGLRERRREAALLKATGWMTDEILLQGVVESLVLAVLGASVAVLVAWGWLAGAGGAGVAPVFLPGAGVDPGFPVPYDLAPVPVLLAFVVSFALVATGTLFSQWRAAAAEPGLVLR